MIRSPDDDLASNLIVSRRALILGGSQLAFMGILGLRMRFMQVEQADQFRLLAEENRVNLRLIPPTRGLIYDRTGDIIAENEQNYRIVMVREDVEGRMKTLKRCFGAVLKQVETGQGGTALHFAGFMGAPLPCPSP